MPSASMSCDVRGAVVVAGRTSSHRRPRGAMRMRAPGLTEPRPVRQADGALGNRAVQAPAVAAILAAHDPRRLVAVTSPETRSRNRVGGSSRCDCQRR